MTPAPTATARQSINSLKDAEPEDGWAMVYNVIPIALPMTPSA
jgi:hypothetical protein